MNDEDKNLSEDSAMNENDEMDSNIDTQEESMQGNSTVSNDDVASNWIEIIDGKFLCGECENESVPETNTVDGTVEADVEQIKKDLQERPTKIVYGSCPVCGMEYLFKEKNNKLYLEPSEMLK